MVATQTIVNAGAVKVSGSKLVQVDAFFDGLSALQAKNWLDQEGIPAFVEGANTNSALYVGSALAGVKLLVAIEDQERAQSILRQYHAEGRDRTTWYCGDCQEFNEPSFDLCWSCGNNREEVERPAPLKGPPKSKLSENEIAENELSAAEIPQRIESGNPFQPPLVMLPAKQERGNKLDHEETEETEKTEENIQRAWRASILGLLIPIPVLHIYSIILLLGVDRSIPISSKSQRQFKLAWSVNIVLVLAVCLVIRTVVIR